MLEGFLRTLVKIAVASLIVGTILAHFGITAEAVAKAALDKLNASGTAPHKY